VNKPLVSIVAPCCNEAQALGTLVERLAAATAPLADRYAFETLLVDDGSTDGSWEAIRALARERPTVRGLRFTRNFGQQAALLAGLDAARGAAVVTLDADGQHPPELIPEMVEKWERGARVVQGLRAEGGAAGPMKRWTSRAFYRVFSWLAGIRIPQGSADFRLLDRSAVDVALGHPHAALFLRGFVPWTGFRTDYVEFEPRPREAGIGKYSPLRMIALARQGILRFSVAPLRLAILVGACTCAFSLAYLVYVILVRAFSGQWVPGWASVAGLLALLGGVQLLVIGILGEYVGMIFEIQLGKPTWVVAETTAPPHDEEAT